MVARANGKGFHRWANVTYWASELNQWNWGWKTINGTCDGQFFSLGKRKTRACNGLDIAIDLSSAKFVSGGWTITVRGNYVYDRLSGPAHRLDVSFGASGGASTRDRPHGIIGQSFSTPEPRVGRLDEYPEAGRFRTSAMAEGAIDGEAWMYEVPGAYATHFAFSRFDSAGDGGDPAPSASKLAGKLAASISDAR